jgi:phosphoenolpyruvate-protein kinase (PTS system EI component)
MANIRLASDVSEAVGLKAEGIGLYRTEFEFITAGRVLDENEQLERYMAVIEAMTGHPVTFRLLDFGGDKLAPFLDLPEQANPYLGLRGSSLLLARPNLLAAQARALARASARAPIRVLYPMVVDVEQFLAVKEMFLKSADDLNVGNIQHGVLFEVPSACLEARRIFEVADFGSIGTNDLVQYLFAVDRNNELVAGAYNRGSQALWSMIGYVVHAANEAGRFLSACGEAAGDPGLLGAFTDAGVRSLSVSPRLIPALRKVAQARGVSAAPP